MNDGGAACRWAGFEMSNSEQGAILSRLPSHTGGQGVLQCAYGTGTLPHTWLELNSER